MFVCRCEHGGLFCWVTRTTSRAKMTIKQVTTGLTSSWQFLLLLPLIPSPGGYFILHILDYKSFRDNNSPPGRDDKPLSLSLQPPSDLRLTTCLFLVKLHLARRPPSLSYFDIMGDGSWVCLSPAEFKQLQQYSECKYTRTVTHYSGLQKYLNPFQLLNLFPYLRLQTYRHKCGFLFSQESKPNETQTWNGMTFIQYFIL